MALAEHAERLFEKGNTETAESLLPGCRQTLRRPRRRALPRRDYGQSDAADGCRGAETERGNRLAVAALLPALPGAANDVLSLADRFQLVPKVERMLDQIRAAARPGDGVVLFHGAGPGIDLLTATQDAVIDQLFRP